VGEEPHGENLLSIVVDRCDETEIVGDIENSYSPIASNSYLICMAESRAGLGKVLPRRGSRYSVPVVEWCPGFGICLFCFIEEFAGYDSHTDR